MSKKLLIIGHNWPEPQSTAAGTRMMQLINVFLKQDYAITFASAVPLEKEDSSLESLGISKTQIALNDAGFDAFVIGLDPTIVLYDRYITEEQYGWRVYENCPNALTILDTEDLHFLRKAREEAVVKKLEWNDDMLFSQTAKRELASILRCDVSLIISEFEMELLITDFKIDSIQLLYLPFMLNAVSNEQAAAWNSFENRAHFVSIGTFMHKPNIDAVILLHKHVWPRIRKTMPTAQLHIYGSYVTSQIMELHKPLNGFHVLGQTENALETIANYRVLLAPLRYGAGLKGKLMDAMLSGTPAVMTPIAAEGMFGDMQSCGLIEDDPAAFAQAAIKLHEQKEDWHNAVQNGLQVINERFELSAFAKALFSTIQLIQADLTAHRNSHFIGGILHHHTLQSTKYLSKWITEKERNKEM
jgi:glycosyltransferase involved in cell wall biosynthesis